MHTASQYRSLPASAPGRSKLHNATSRPPKRQHCTASAAKVEARHNQKKQKVPLDVLSKASQGLHQVASWPRWVRKEWDEEYDLKFAAICVANTVAVFGTILAILGGIHEVLAWE